jgi:hypothetical protein
VAFTKWNVWISTKIRRANGSNILHQI